jgi:hypothetical protein
MSMQVNKWELLAQQTRRGDCHASAQLRRHVQPHLAIIVRRAIRTDDDHSPLTRRIRTAARQTARDCQETPTQDQERLVKPVARRLCDWLLTRLQGRAGDTRATNETVRV